MDRIDREIWKELLVPEREAARPAPKAQSKDDLPQATHWSAPVLKERAAYLRKLAQYGDGQASETLKEYPQHATMLSVRGRDGIAEQHENFADLFYVLEGRATLVSGGTVSGAETVAPGEIRGCAIDGGKRHELRAGDVAHVPAGIPHQILVSGEKTFTAFVVKVRQNP